MKEVARRTDTVDCPHGEGPIQVARDRSVLVAWEEVAVALDYAYPEGGDEHVIDRGCGTVFVGGLPLARRSDPLDPDGRVVQGWGSVLCGDRPGVTIERRGEFFLIVDPSQRTVRIAGIQEYKGAGATDAFIAEATAQINDVWTATFQRDGETWRLETRIVGQRWTSQPRSNDIEVAHSEHGISTTSQKDPSWQERGGDEGYQHDTDNAEGDLVSAHEFGHAIGLEDEYEEGPRNADGTRNTVRTGPAGGIMGHIEPGSRPTQQNVEALLAGRSK